MRLSAPASRRWIGGIAAALACAVLLLASADAAQSAGPAGRRTPPARGRATSSSDLQRFGEQRRLDAERNLRRLSREATRRSEAARLSRDATPAEVRAFVNRVSAEDRLDELRARQEAERAFGATALHGIGHAGPRFAHPQHARPALGLRRVEAEIDREHVARAAARRSRAADLEAAAAAREPLAPPFPSRFEWPSGVVP